MYIYSYYCIIKPTEVWGVVMTEGFGSLGKSGDDDKSASTVFAGIKPILSPSLT